MKKYLLVVLVLLLAGCGEAERDSSNFAATETRSVEIAQMADVSVTQTADSAPTATPTAEPTPTTPPEPTKTPTPRPTPTEDSSTFTQPFFALNEEIMTIMEDFVELASDPQFFDATWRAGLYDVSERMNDARDDVRDLDPPPAYRDAYDHYLDGIANVDEGFELIVEGVEDMDAEKIEDATDLIEEGTDDISKAVADMPQS